MDNIKSIENIFTSRGNAALNQYILHTPEGAFFSSYNRLIAFQPIKGKVKLDSNNWNISATTTKYLKQFLDENLITIKKKIALGEYELTDLSQY
jgi:hypothetical protein